MTHRPCRPVGAAPARCRAAPALRSATSYARAAAVAVPAFALALIAAALAPTDTHAQELRGRIVAEGTPDSPIEGAIVTLLDPDGLEVTAAFTNQVGVFRLVADSAGEYHVRVDRIGLERWRSDPFVLAEGAPLIIELEVPIRPVRLVDLDVSVYKECVNDPRDAAEVELVFDEARKALESALLAQTMQLFRYSSVVFDRSIARRGDQILEVKTFGTEGVSQAPFRSLAAERLSEDGYIQEEGTTVYYYAPDATVLLSDTFQADHCFGLDREERDGRALVGLTFEPRDDRDLPDIDGVMWLDEATNALDHIEFRYENIPFEDVDDDRIAGVVEYGRLPTGAFIVRDWYIRMPKLAHVERRDDYVIEGFNEYGGELRDVSEPDGAPVDWHEAASISGEITNPMTGAPLRDATLVLDVPRGDDRVRHTGPNGRFFFDGLEPGEYEIRLEHSTFAALDIDEPEIEFVLGEGERREIGFELPDPQAVLEDFCGDDSAGTVVILGTVRDDESDFPIRFATVRAQWTEMRESTEPGDDHGRVIVESDGARTNGRGQYALCDVPVGLDIALLVSAPGGIETARTLRTARLVNIVDFRLSPPR